MLETYLSHIAINFCGCCVAGGKVPIWGRSYLILIQLLILIISSLWLILYISFIFFENFILLVQNKTIQSTSGRKMWQWESKIFLFIDFIPPWPRFLSFHTPVIPVMVRSYFGRHSCAPYNPYNNNKINSQYAFRSSAVESIKEKVLASYSWLRSNLWRYPLRQITNGLKLVTLYLFIL